MTLGQRILQARQAAGLSQRQLAGGEITRNMLSALEHDAANPSVATLRYLSERLGKPVSWFLGEDQPAADGYETLLSARAAYDAGEFRQCAELLDAAQPGEVLQREWELLRLLALMARAEAAIGAGRLPYARELLGRVGQLRTRCPYWTREREYRLLLARSGEAAELLSDDDALLLRAKLALADGRWVDAARCLDAAEDRTGPTWHHLRGEVDFAQGDYKSAAEHFHRAEAEIDLRERLEICYRELEDYKMAYFYAKK